MVTIHLLHKLTALANKDDVTEIKKYIKKSYYEMLILLCTSVSNSLFSMKVRLKYL